MVSVLDCYDFIRGDMDGIIAVELSKGKELHGW